MGEVSCPGEIPEQRAQAFLIRGLFRPRVTAQTDSHQGRWAMGGGQAAGNFCFPSQGHALLKSCTPSTFQGELAVNSAVPTRICMMGARAARRVHTWGLTGYKSVWAAMVSPHSILVSNSSIPVCPPQLSREEEGS